VKTIGEVRDLGELTSEKIHRAIDFRFA
jgi:hypothetical protein